MREAPALAVSVGSRGRADGTRKVRVSAKKAARPPSLLGRAFARPGVTIAGAAFAAVMTGIVANAVLFQTGRHPSPLFVAPSRPTAAIQPVVTPAATRPSQPLPPAPTVAAPRPAVSPDPPAALVPAVPTHPRHGAAPPAKPGRDLVHAHKDLIGALLKQSGDTTAKPNHPVQPAAAKPGPGKTAAVSKRKGDGVGGTVMPPD